jgi:hypothetical protein
MKFDRRFFSSGCALPFGCCCWGAHIALLALRAPARRSDDSSSDI